MKRIQLLLLALCIAANCYCQNYVPPGAGSIEFYMIYATMRPMALVKQLTTGNNSWGIKNDKIIPSNQMREVMMEYAGYTISTIFNNENDVLTVEYPYDAKIYNADMNYLTSHGFEQRKYPERKGNKLTEGYAKGINWIIGVDREIGSNNQITMVKYYFFLHP